MGHIEERLNTYARACGMAQVPSPDAVLRAQLEGVVTCHARLRVLIGNKPRIAEWRTAAGVLARLARNALDLDVVPFPILPGAGSPLFRTLVRHLLPALPAAGNVREWRPLERADLELLATRAQSFAATLRDRPGPKVDVALRELRSSVSDIIELCCGPESAKCYSDDLAGGGAGLLYEVVAKLQPWLLGLEELTPNALRLALQRAQAQRRPRVKAQNSRRRVRS
jgi:hypothetical protein